jgi:serine O-acetyltransferase
MVVHNGNVFLNAQSVGDNFTIYQGVTVGDKLNYDGKSEKQIPTIKDNVTICTGAVVFGNITLNDNCVVGCNRVVTKNVEENTVVAGAPAKIIKSNM